MYNVVYLLVLGSLVLGSEIFSPKLKLVLHPVQQSGSYWDRTSALPLVGVEPTQS